MAEIIKNLEKKVLHLEAFSEATRDVNNKLIDNLVETHEKLTDRHTVSDQPNDQIFNSQATINRMSNLGFS